MNKHGNNRLYKDHEEGNLHASIVMMIKNIETNTVNKYINSNYADIQYIVKRKCKGIQK